MALFKISLFMCGVSVENQCIFDASFHQFVKFKAHVKWSHVSSEADTQLPYLLSFLSIGPFLSFFSLIG